MYPIIAFFRGRRKQKKSRERWLILLFHKIWHGPANDGSHLQATSCQLRACINQHALHPQNVLYIIIFFVCVYHTESQLHQKQGAPSFFYLHGATVSYFGILMKTYGKLKTSLQGQQLAEPPRASFQKGKGPVSPHHSTAP